MTTTLSTVANSIDLLTCYYDGIYLLCSLAKTIGGAVLSYTGYRPNTITQQAGTIPTGLLGAGHTYSSLAEASDTSNMWDTGSSAVVDSGTAGFLNLYAAVTGTIYSGFIISGFSGAVTAGTLNINSAIFTNYDTDPPAADSSSNAAVYYSTNSGTTWTSVASVASGSSSSGNIAILLSGITLANIEVLYILSAEHEKTGSVPNVYITDAASSATIYDVVFVA